MDTLDAIRSPTGYHVRDLSKPGLFLDADTLEKYFTHINKRVGAVPAFMGSRFAQNVARRIAIRIARQNAERLQIPAQTLAEAWYFALWCEISTLIPLRHLARHIAKQATGNLVLIPVSVNQGTYLSYWGRSSLEPLHLLLAIRRAGGNALLVFDTLETTPSSRPITRETVTLRYGPHSIWDVPHPAINAPHQPEGKGVKALAVSGIRGGLQILAKIGGARLVQGPFNVTQASTHENLFRRSDQLPMIDLTFRKVRRRMLLPTGVKVYSTKLPEPNLLIWFSNIVGQRTQDAAIEACRIVKDQGIVEAHVCDHLFFESALMAGAVRDAQGRVIVWPHSSNALHVLMRKDAPPHRVYGVRRSQVAAWTSQFTRMQTEIMSELLFSPFQGARAPISTAPLTVVIIAGAHTLNRMPIVDITKHTDSYRRLLAGLAGLAPRVRIVVKAKPPFEPFEWLASLAPAGEAIEQSNESPNIIDLPNMIFVSVSYGSTALMEGLSRGIPCMVVRETPVEDYAPVDPESVPIGSVEAILTELEKCLDPEYFSRMGGKQFDWFIAETNFNSDPKGP